jgi:hypothetical protein
VPLSREVSELRTAVASQERDARPAWRVILGAGAAMVVGVAVLPLIGSAPVDYGRALAGQWPDQEIPFYAQLPRVLLAPLARAAQSAGSFTTRPVSVPEQDFGRLAICRCQPGCGEMARQRRTSWATPKAP